MSGRTERLRRVLAHVQRANKALAAAGLAAACVAAAGIAWAAEPAAAAVADTGDASRWGFVSAALSVGLACIGAGYAVAHVGAASMGAVSERPELAGRALIFVGLAEGVAIYGLIVSVMILGRL
jgi:V/A-type H+-transporting ATPase subunit K